MSTSDFDNFSKRYEELLDQSYGVLPTGDKTFFDLYKIDCIETYISNRPGCAILDFGCGVGKLSFLLAERFPESKVDGYDVSINSLQEAQRKCSNFPNASFLDSLDRPERYGVIVAANVFHHIDKEKRKEILRQLKSFLSPGGVIVIFEHNPFNPFTQYVVSRCPFDKGVELIRRQQMTKMAGGVGLQVMASRYVLMFPWRQRIFRWVEDLFEGVPLGAQYMTVLGEWPATEL